jgi:hypothetical protein
MGHAARMRETRWGDNIRIDLIETGWRATSHFKAVVGAIFRSMCYNPALATAQQKPLEVSGTLQSQEGLLFSGLLKLGLKQLYVLCRSMVMN